MAVRLSIGASRGQLVAAAARRVVPAGALRRRRRPGRRAVDAGPDGGAAAGARRPTTVSLTIDPIVLLFAGGAGARHRPAVRPVPGAAQHAARSGLVAQGTERPAVAARGRPRASARRSRRRRSRCRWRCSCRRGCSRKSLFNVSRVDLGLQGRQRRHVRRLAGAERLHARAIAAAVRAARGRAGGAARASPASRARTVPLLAGSNWGNDVSVEGFKAGPDTDIELALQRGRPGLLPDARHPAARRPRVHARRRARPRRRSRSSTRRSRRSSTSGATPSASAWATTGRNTPLTIEIVGARAEREVQRGQARDPAASSSRPTGRTRRSARSTSTCGPARDPERFLAQHPEGDGAARLRTCRSRTCGRCRSRCARTCSSIGSSARCRRRSPAWRRCSRRSGSTACSPTPCRSGRARSACGWRSAPRRRGCGAMVLRQVGVMTLIGGAIGLGGGDRARPAGAVAAVRAEGLRSGRARRRGGVAVARRARRRLHPRAPRVAGRSDERAEIRVAVVGGQTFRVGVQRSDFKVRP